MGLLDLRRGVGATALQLLVLTARAAAQAPERPGSFVLSTIAAAAGSVVAIAATATFAVDVGSSDCPAVPGARCSGGINGGAIATIGGASLLGAATGAVIGRHLMGGRQSFARSLVGAALGTLVGGAVASQLRTTEVVPLTLSFVVPQGLFAALVGR